MGDARETWWRFSDWATKQEWAIVASTVAAIIMEFDTIVMAVNDGVEDAAGDLSWQSLLVIVLGVVIRSKVWAENSVPPNAADPHHVEPD